MGCLGWTLPALPCFTCALPSLPAWPRNHSFPGVAGLEEHMMEGEETWSHLVPFPGA